MAGRLSVAAFAVLVVAGAAGCSSGAPGGPPLALTGAVSAGGYPALGGGPEGVTLRFIDRGRFGIGLALRNRSGRSVTIVGARVLEPPRTLIHQVGTRLVSWNPPPCPPRVRGCIFRDFFRPSYGAVRPLPVTAAPKKQVGVQLNFRLGSCRAVPSASPAAPRLLLVDYRYGYGALRRQTLPLGSARLRLRMPQPGDCAHRPHSKISVDGPYGASSDWTVPGSDGDSCRRTPTGALRFRSRLYQFPRRPTVRVAIRLPRFRGRGTYYRAQVHVVVSGGRGWTVLRAERSLVRVTHVGRTTFGGRFRARLTDRLGAPFRTYGAWRCTTRWK